MNRTVSDSEILSNIELPYELNRIRLKHYQWYSRFVAVWIESYQIESLPCESKCMRFNGTGTIKYWIIALWIESYQTEMLLYESNHIRFSGIVKYWFLGLRIKIISYCWRLSHIIWSNIESLPYESKSFHSVAGWQALSNSFICIIEVILYHF